LESCAERAVTGLDLRLLGNDGALLAVVGRG
jgi:hypothetical protein